MADILSGSVIVMNESLYIIHNDEPILVSNAYKQDDGFHLVHGWHIYPDPLDVLKTYEYKIENEKSHIIKQVVYGDK